MAVAPAACIAVSLLPTAVDLLEDLAEVTRRFHGVGTHGAVLVAAGDEVVYREAFGFADREARRPMSPDTVFTLGSITKSFTAAAILKLESEGSLSVADTLADHFADVPEDRRGITLHQLLTHTAGLPDALGDDWDLDGTRERVLAGALGAPLEHSPGSAYRYSNLGYSLLGMVVEDVSRRPYETYLREAFFLPLGMERTGYLAPGFAEQDLAVGYRDGERWGTVLFRPMLADGPSWHLRANGGLHSTLGDMQRWATALLEGRALPEAAREKAFAPHVDGGRRPYGYGWEVEELREGRRRIGHSGGNGVFSTYFRLYPEDGLMLLVTSTTAEVSVGRLVRAFEAALFGEVPELPPPTVRLDAEVLGRGAGRWVAEGGGAFEVEVLEPGVVLRALDGAARRAIAPEDSSAELRELVARTEDALFRAREGDFTMLRDVFGVERSLADFEASERATRAQLVAERGELLGIETVDARRAGSGADIVVRFDHARRDLLLLMEWRGGAIGEVREIDDLPRPRFELFPVSPTEYAALGVSPSVGLRATLEEDRWTLDGPAGRLELRRAQ